MEILRILSLIVIGCVAGIYGRRLAPMFEKEKAPEYEALSERVQSLEIEVKRLKEIIAITTDESSKDLKEFKEIFKELLSLYKCE